MSEDNIPIVFNDSSLRRLVGRSELIKGMLAKDLESIRLPNGDTIPCLESVLDLVSGRVPLLIEIKDQDGKLTTDGSMKMNQNFILAETEIQLNQILQLKNLKILFQTIRLLKNHYLTTAGKN